MKYDLSNLDPRLFERLCADIIQRETRQRVEIFSAGIDGGIDGRFWIGDKEKGILQSKHYPNESYSRIKSSIVEELKKVKKIKPDRYIFMTSAKVTVGNKKDIKDHMSPYIKKEDDIWGFDEIQNFLLDENNFDIVKKYPQLFIFSIKILQKVLGDNVKKILLSDVNGRSSFLLDEIKEKLNIFVYTNDFYNALKKVSENNTVVITGEAGIGKTTLSNMIAFEYIKNGYVFYNIANINEAEKILSNSDEGEKIIFYYNDFLGESFKHFMIRDESSQIMLFINRVNKLKNIRLILNSRTTILNKAIQDSHTLKDKKIDKNEYILKIENLKTIDRAYMLYKHMYFSDLDESYIDEIYKDKKYKNIIQHKNFSPRIIEYILDKDRIQNVGIEKSNYFSYIKKSLDNPKDIWSDYFEKIDNCTKSIILLTTFNKGKISDEQLKLSYINYIELNKIESKSESSFVHNINIALNSLIEKQIEDGNFQYRLFNPSVGDYVVNEYFNNNEKEITIILLSLKNIESLQYFHSLIHNKIISKEKALRIQKKIFDSLFKEKLDEKDFQWLLFVIKINEDNLDKDKILFIISEFIKLDYDEIKFFYPDQFFNFYYLIDEYHDVLKFEKNNYLWSYINNEMSQYDFEYLFKFLLENNIQDEDLNNALVDNYEEYIMLNLDDYLDINYNNYVDVDSDGSYVVDEYGISEKISDVIKNEFINSDFIQNFLSQTSFNISNVVDNLKSGYGDRAVENFEDGYTDEINIDLYKGDYYKTEDIEIDQIFKR